MRRPHRGLTAREVLTRMKRGDLPTYGGGYAVNGFFDDGARASRGVMRRLVKADKVNYPAHTSVHSRWTLVEGSK